MFKNTAAYLNHLFSLALQFSCFTSQRQRKCFSDRKQIQIYLLLSRTTILNGEIALGISKQSRNKAASLSFLHLLKSQDPLAPLSLSLSVLITLYLLYLNTVIVISVPSLHALQTQCLMLTDLLSLATNSKFQNRECNWARQDSG